MSDFDKLAEQFEKMLDNEYETEGKVLLQFIENHLATNNWSCSHEILVMYDKAVERDVWDQQLVEELQEVKVLLLNLQ